MKTAASSCIRVTKTTLLWNSIEGEFEPAMTPALTRLRPFTGEDLSITGKGEKTCSMKNGFSSKKFYNGKGWEYFGDSRWLSELYELL